MRKLFTICGLLATHILSAQFGTLSPDFTTYIFGDKVNVRAEAKPDAKVVAQLNGGDLVTILEQSPQNYESAGNTQPWYKVKFNKNQTGYIWGGVLSYSGETNSAGVHFAVGITAAKPNTKSEDMTDYSLETRAFSTTGALLSKTSQVVTATEGYYFHAQPVLNGALGLKGYSGLLHSNFSFDACGVPSFDWYVLWNGKNLVPLPLCTSISDADVFYHTESYLFPEAEDENGQGHFAGEDKLFFVVEHSEKQYISDDENAGWNEDMYVRVRPVKWEGGKFVTPEVEK